MRDGDANFAIDAPPLQLVLIEGEDGGRLDHLGDAAARLSAAGLVTFDEGNVECCYA